MKLTPKVLTIPPYLSTTWKAIASMHVQGKEGSFCLIVSLKTGQVIEVPALDKESVTKIFEAHVQYSGSPSSSQEPKPEPSNEGGVAEPISFSFPFKGEGSIAEAFGTASQHNPEQSDLPSLSPGVLKKITAIAEAFGMEAIEALSPAEPGCNCIYCQVVNALRGDGPDEEEVTEEDLKFRSWDVRQTADKLYIVTNPIDENEHYNVYLGEPLGCTCGEKNCEHIRAVLNT